MTSIAEIDKILLIEECKRLKIRIKELEREIEENHRGQEIVEDEHDQ